MNQQNATPQQQTQNTETRFFQLTDTQVNNLIIFLRRVNLTGEEVPAYNEIINAITQPVRLPKPAEILNETDIDALIKYVVTRAAGENKIDALIDFLESQTQAAPPQQEQKQDTVQPAEQVTTENASQSTRSTNLIEKIRGLNIR